ncbi:MAG: hypothetical protein J7L96_07810 [Bacteroidales bacterium]|nr:hypothetical protein [Bacteroidales bacterium]
MQRLAAIIRLGELFRSFESANNSSGRRLQLLEQAASKAEENNPWFTRQWIAFAFKVWGQTLTEENLNHWLKKYDPSPVTLSASTKRVLIIMAGNLPLVGLHDFLCTFLAGHITLAKLSSKDAVLLPAIIDILKTDFPDISKYIEYSAGEESQADVLIATGSNTTRLHFEYAFPGIPRLLRGNRNSLAVMSGSEGEEEISKLVFDIKAFFGLGCRSVSLVFSPDISHIKRLAAQLKEQYSLLQTVSYANNIRQQRAIMKQNKTPFIDSNEVLLTENNNTGSSIGVLHYVIYSSSEEIIHFIDNKRNDIQCVIGDSHLYNTAIPLGKSQYPDLWDYADELDTLTFLSTL